MAKKTVNKGAGKAAPKRGAGTVASNRRARYDYAIAETFEAGLVLSGTEVKSLREGRASLVDGFTRIRKGEAWLENVDIPTWGTAAWTNHSPRQSRKLLLHRAEIDRLERKLQEPGLALVPLRLYFTRGRAKVELGLGRGKREWDKRQALRARQDRREAERAIASRSWR